MCVCTHTHSFHFSYRQNKSTPIFFSGTANRCEMTSKKLTIYVLGYIHFLKNPIQKCKSPSYHCEKNIIYSEYLSGKCAHIFNYAGMAKIIQEAVVPMGLTGLGQCLE